MVAVMGPNGMGKSTLLAAIAGILSPQHGHIEIDGMVRRRTEDEELAIRKKVAYLPADAWLPAMVTGREFLLAVGRLYAVDDDRLFDHIERLIPLFSLEEKADSAIASYSTGQKKKIALASALVTDAPILLLDEPFAGGLDPAGILAMKHVLKHFAQCSGPDGGDRRAGARTGRGGGPPDRRPAQRRDCRLRHGSRAAPHGGRRRFVAGRARPSDGSADHEKHRKLYRLYHHAPHKTYYRILSCEPA
jgi:ABC-type transport system involved in cytochrome c biogenesis ATPase subunit